MIWRINHQIRSAEVRVLDRENKQIGVMKLNDALEEARRQGLDLIEIAPKAMPPVAKIIEFGKFKYQEEKKARKQKKGVKTPELKEIRFSPFIGDADYDTRIERMDEFLKEGNKVRAVVKFTGRQMGSKEFGYKVLNRIVETFKDRIVVDMQPKFLGRQLVMVISPTNKKVTVEPKIDVSEENS